MVGAVSGLCLALIGIAGCSDGSGFRPLYGQTTSGIGVQASMRKIDVRPIPSRVGQRIRNELIFQNTGGGEADQPAYRLEISIKESLGTSFVKSTGESLSQIYALEAVFSLVRISDKKVLIKSNSNARAEFERFQQIYSNVRAKDDAENRAARQIADDIRTRVAIALSREQA
jgi:LPS-assembly lipoprotein